MQKLNLKKSILSDTQKYTKKNRIKNLAVYL